VLKSKLRKKILKVRQKFNTKNIQINFNQIIKILKRESLELLREFKKNKFNISLPIIKKNFQMDFYSWSFSEPLKINKYGIPEPESKNIVYPDVLLIPLLAFDKNLNRLGYGGGYYDRLIERLSKKKNIIKIGLAFSIQEIDKVPINMYDQKLDYIVTNKHIIK
jgi:5-formyltetrahydrofolate cyclo-ligase